MPVKFVDNSPVILRRMASNALEAMKAGEEVLVESVQHQMLYGYHTPHGKDGHTEIVDTGALFDSIEAETTKSSMNAYTTNVGSSLKYASYVHDGTSKLQGRPFIKDGIMAASDQWKDTLAAILPEGIT